jgi:CubicO group peptidase (beta-lactamase class C family)
MKRAKIASLVLVWAAFAGLSGETQKEVAAERFLGRGDYRGEYWPTGGWRSCRPESVGVNPEKLARVYAYAANPAIKTQGLVIIRRGYIVGEAYFGGFTMDTRKESFSVAKSFASALVGIAIDKGFIKGVDEPVAQYYPQWQTAETPLAKKKMTIEDLLTMRSGLQWNEDDYYRDRSRNDVYLMIDSAPDYVEYVLRKPVLHEPGTHWYYSSGDSILLSGIIQKSTGLTAGEFARRNLFEPLGLTGMVWLSDPAGRTITGWGIQGTLREFAKFGYLYLRNGVWAGRQVVSREWVKKSGEPVSEEVKKYGYQWWRLPALGKTEGSEIPPDILIAWGIFTQQIFILPSRDLLIVRLGHDPDPTHDEWREAEFLSLVLDSLEEQ